MPKRAQSLVAKARPQWRALAHGELLLARQSGIEPRKWKPELYELLGTWKPIGESPSATELKSAKKILVEIINAKRIGNKASSAEEVAAIRKELAWKVLLSGYGDHAPSARPDLYPWLSPKGPTIGPVSAEYVAKWLRSQKKLPHGRGERFLHEYVGAGFSEGAVPAKQTSERTWEFERAAMERCFPGVNWEAMMLAYGAKNREAKRARVGKKYRRKGSTAD